MCAMRDTQAAIALTLGIEARAVFLQVTSPDSLGGRDIVGPEVAKLEEAQAAWLAQSDTVDVVEAECQQLRTRGPYLGFNKPLARRVREWGQINGQAKAPSWEELEAA